jgi:hypothetical protein
MEARTGKAKLPNMDTMTDITRDDLAALLLDMSARGLFCTIRHTRVTDPAGTLHSYNGHVVPRTDMPVPSPLWTTKAGHTMVQLFGRTVASQSEERTTPSRGRETDEHGRGHGSLRLATIQTVAAGGKVYRVTD